MTAGRKRPAGRAKHTSGEHPATPETGSPVTGRDKPRVVQQLPPGTELPPSQRSGRLSRAAVRARIAAGWAEKGKHDDEETP